jgi:hypothetical protein
MVSFRGERGRDRVRVRVWMIDDMIALSMGTDLGCKNSEVSGDFK